MPVEHIFSLLLLFFQLAHAQLEPISDTLFLQVCNESIVRVLALPVSGQFPSHPSLVVRPAWPSVDYNVSHAGDLVVITTNKLKARVELCIFWEEKGGEGG